MRIVKHNSFGITTYYITINKWYSLLKYFNIISLWISHRLYLKIEVIILDDEYGM